MKNIIVSARSRWLGKEGGASAKDYPYMQALCDLYIKDGYRLIQIGVGNEPKLTGCEHVFDKHLLDIEKLLKDTGYFIAVDNFLHHMASAVGVTGMVLFGPSDPQVFGYPDQVNIIKDRSLLRPDQFGFYHLDYVWPHAFTGWYAPEMVYNMGKVRNV